MVYDNNRKTRMVENCSPVSKLISNKPRTRSSLSTFCVHYDDTAALHRAILLMIGSPSLEY